MLLHPVVVAYLDTSISLSIPLFSFRPFSLILLSTTTSASLLRLRFFHFSLHSLYFLEDWCVLQQIWQCNESNRRSAQIYVGKFRNLAISSRTNNIRETHIHGVFGAHQETAVDFAWFELYNKWQVSACESDLFDSMFCNAPPSVMVLTSTVIFIPSASNRSLIGTLKLPDKIVPQRT